MIRDIRSDLIALGNEVRIDIIAALREANVPMSASEVASAIGRPYPTVAHNLQHMRLMGLLLDTGRDSDRNRLYVVNEMRMVKIKEHI